MVGRVPFDDWPVRNPTDLDINNDYLLVVNADMGGDGGGRVKMFDYLSWAITISANVSIPFDGDVFSSSYPLKVASDEAYVLKVTESDGTAIATFAAAGVTIGDGLGIVAGTTTGLKVGTAATQKLGFFGATPVVQQKKADHNDWVALSDVIAALVALGLLDEA